MNLKMLKWFMETNIFPGYMLHSKEFPFPFPFLVHCFWKKTFGEETRDTCVKEATQRQAVGDLGL